MQTISMVHYLLFAPSRLEDEAEDGDVDGSGQKYKTITELKREEAMQRAGTDYPQGLYSEVYSEV